MESIDRAHATCMSAIPMWERGRFQGRHDRAILLHGTCLKQWGPGSIRPGVSVG